ncbi:hypothetical protein HDV02_006184 [Globomyces sp. JEL0801]|nr:hypothetical protein HDV02_006184 [Globomyces sp. JEL0801]
MSLKFPLYMAINELFMYMVLMTDQLRPMIYKTNWDGVPCRLLGSSVFFLSMSNMILVSNIAVITFKAVCHEVTVHTGKYDWKLLLFNVTLCTILTSSVYPYAGQSKYWCYNDNSNRSIFMPLLSVGIQVFFFCITIISFFFVLKRVQVQKSLKDSCIIGLKEIVKSPSKYKSNSIDDEKGSPKQILERVVARKVLTYILNYFIQWAPIAPYTVGAIFGYYEDWVYVLTNIALNCGGLLNFIAFVRNEGWSDEA